MTTPYTFGGPVNLAADPTTSLNPATKQYCDGKLPYMYMNAFASPGGLPETVRQGSITETIPFYVATASTLNTAKTITAAFPVGWDAQVPSKVVTGFQFWVATAPSAANQSCAFALYTGGSLSTFNRSGSNGSFTCNTGTTGLKQVPFASTFNFSGTSIVYVAVQFSFSAPASGTGVQLAATQISTSNLQGQGGKYGEWTTSTVTPGATLDASAAANSAQTGQLVWVALY